MIAIATQRIAKNIVPAIKVPVRSTKTPINDGPANPPISATQKNIPPAAPIYSVSTLGFSISISSISGMKGELTNPSTINPMQSGMPDILTTKTRLMVVIKAKIAIIRPMKRGGIRDGINKRAGIPVAMGMEAA